VTIETLGTSRLIASRSSDRQRVRTVSPVPLRTPPAFWAACANEQQVRADTLDLRLDRRRRALPDTHHRDHRGNADDDAEA
jgi:hypothetical protein